MKLLPFFFVVLFFLSSCSVENDYTIFLTNKTDSDLIINYSCSAAEKPKEMAGQIKLAAGEKQMILRTKEITDKQLQDAGGNHCSVVDFQFTIRSQGLASKMQSICDGEIQEEHEDIGQYSLERKITKSDLRVQLK